MNYDLWEPKRRIEQQYKSALDKIVDYLQQRINGITDPLEIVSKLRFLVDDPVFKDYAQTTATKMVTHLFTDAGKTWRTAARVNSSGRNIYQELKTELKGQRGLYVAEQIKRNAGIIKSLPIDIADEVTKHVYQQTLTGKRASEIAEEIHVLFPNKTKAKAQLIARTEVSKTQSALTKARCDFLDIKWYIWRTSKDSRVRKSHDHMEGVLVRWTDPPSPEKLIGERSAGRYHAGDIYNCRCYAEPLINLNSISWPCKVYYGDKIKTMTRHQFEQIAA